MKKTGLIELGAIVLSLVVLVSMTGLFSLSSSRRIDLGEIDLISPTQARANANTNAYESWTNIGFESYYDDLPLRLVRYIEPIETVQDIGKCEYTMTVCFDNERADENRCTQLSGTGQASFEGGTFFSSQYWDLPDFRCFIGDIDQDKAYEQVGWGDISEFDRESGVLIKSASVTWDWTPIDSDNDGFYDPEDECPETGDLGEGVDNQGCPYGDLDNDGILDRFDECPNTYGSKQNGCPTTVDSIFNIFRSIRDYIINLFGL